MTTQAESEGETGEIMSKRWDEGGAFITDASTMKIRDPP